MISLCHLNLSPSTLCVNFMSDPKICLPVYCLSEATSPLPTRSGSVSIAINGWDGLSHHVTSGPRIPSG